MSPWKAGRNWLVRITGAILAVASALAVVAAFPPTRSRQQGDPLAYAQWFWLTDGYGRMLQLEGDTLRIFEITQMSCILVSEVKRNLASHASKEIVFDHNGEVTRLTPGESTDTQWLHEDGAISSILLRRTDEKPNVCGHSVSDTPITNYQVFWTTFAEHYPFFALRKMDWAAVGKRFRPQVTASTKPEELFNVLSDMIEPLHDAHTFIDAKSIKQRFHGYRTPDPMQKKNAPRITEIIEKQYVQGGVKNFCNKQLQFGMLQGSVGYLRIHSFSDYSGDKEFAKQLDALETALDAIFADAAKWTGMVIDVRINTGGSDVFGISIASRLATQEYLAYSKVIRNDLHDPDHRTSPQPVIVHVSARPGFRGAVTLLTSADSVSAAETFTMAILDRQPHVTRIGANTQGVFSDVLGRKLPNGWSFGLPNEIYLTKDGQAFDGPGVPPDIQTPIFPAEDLANSRDSAIDRALQLLGEEKKASEAGAAQNFSR
jgi:Peptidase family S41/Tricorn protease C1 domain